jgi:lysozyme
MDSQTLYKLQQLIIEHERYRRYVYTDTTGLSAHEDGGILTVGIGRNLEAKGISMDEALYLLNNDIKQCEKELTANISFYTSLDDVRKCALIDLCFNLGIMELVKFEMLEEMKNKNYIEAVNKLKKTLWFKEVGKERSDDIIFMILNQKWPAYIK